MKIAETLFATALGLAAISGVDAFFRMPCSQPVVVERADPIVAPGAIAGHVHSVMGGNGFNFTQDYNTARASTCSSCQAKMDASNYWVPTLYYQAQNGSFLQVTQNGGALIYYLQRYSSNSNELTPFPPGFRMLAGTPTLRSYNASDLTQQAVSWVCLNYATTSPQTPAIPNNNCPDGLRAQVFFPSCWDGVNLDSANHKDHVAYPDHMDSGDCPASHPVRFISIFYEVIWNINDFADMWWHSDGSHPFVLSMGDPTGYGHHGDFLNGWDETALATAINECTSDSGVIQDCGANLELFTDDEISQCRNPDQVDEVITGWLDTLPGCNAVQDGPEAATEVTSCGKPTPAILSLDQVAFIKQDIPLWDGVGCAQDNLNARVLPNKFTNPEQTIENCVSTCHTNGYTYAGLEWGIECWCGNSFDTTTEIPQGACAQPCAGDSSEMCGDAGVLSVYHYNPNKVSTNTTASTPNTSGSAPQSTTTSINGVTMTLVPPASSTSTPENTADTPGNVQDDSTSSSTAAPAPAPTTTSLSNDAISVSPTGGDAPSGWLYRGCYVDTVWPQRTLPGDGMWYDVPMTPQACTAHCASKGFVISGTEYAGECYCGNSFNGTVIQRPESECNMPCKGNSTVMCGGAARMSVYSRDMRFLKRDVDLGTEYEERDLAQGIDERSPAPIAPVENDAHLQEREPAPEPAVVKRNISNVVRSPSSHGIVRRTTHRRNRLSLE